MVVRIKADEVERSSDYDDQEGLSARGKPPKKPARKPTGQKRKFASKLLPKDASREQRSSSEDSVIKLLQYSPTIHEKNESEDEDDSFAISRDAYAKLAQRRSEYESSGSEAVEMCYNAQNKSFSTSEGDRGQTSSSSEMPASSVTQNLSELDTLLADLSSAAQQRQQQQQDYDSGSVNYSNKSYPARPPPPQSYDADKSPKTSKKAAASPSPAMSCSPVPAIAARIPRRRPPKLMHVLKNGAVHDLCKEAREDYNMEAEVELEAEDYDYSFGAPSMSNYSTLGTLDTRTREQEYDYSTLNKSEVPVSEDELEKATGAGPRGDRSRLIETDAGVVQSKYRYMGFGLWENLDPAAPKKVKKRSPPPPPPKAEPIMYDCTVKVSKTISSKELDDLVTRDMFTNMKNGEVEVADGVGDLGAGIGEPFEMFEKEDMSDMFKRAMLEKMGLVDEPRAKYKCCVCEKLIQNRCITAMGNKFHPECFVCTYCRGPFRERKYKTDPRDRKPYCKDCFEKLLGHYGDAHEALGRFVEVHAALG